MTLHLESGPSIGPLRIITICETATNAGRTGGSIWASATKTPLAVALVSKDSVSVWTLSEDASALAARLAAELPKTV